MEEDDDDNGQRPNGVERWPIAEVHGRER